MNRKILFVIIAALSRFPLMLLSLLLTLSSAMLFLLSTLFLRRPPAITEMPSVRISIGIMP